MSSANGLVGVLSGFSHVFPPLSLCPGLHKGYSRLGWSAGSIMLSLLLVDPDFKAINRSFIYVMSAESSENGDIVRIPKALV